MPRYSAFSLGDATSDGNPFGITLEELTAQYESTPPRLDRPTSIALQDIKLATNAFQPRQAWNDLMLRDQHIHNITEFLTRNPLKDTDPLTITVVGDDFFLIDGHHRFKAYHVAKRQTAPVVYFDGDPVAAKKQSLILNSTGKLSLLPSERKESAFALVKLGASEKEVVELGLASRATYYTMKKKLTDYPEMKDARWATACRYNGKERPATPPPEGYVNPKSHDIAGYLSGILPASSSALPILSDALEALSPNLPSELITYWSDPQSPGYNKRHHQVTSYFDDGEDEDA